MNLAELQSSLEMMSEQELSRFVKRCICQTLYGATKIKDVDAHVALDMVYAECARRGNERLYDMAHEAVSKNPNICDAA